MSPLTEEYMKKEDTYGVIKTVDIFISWVTAASQIEYLGLRRGENPIFGQIDGYFDQLMKRIMKHNSLEGMFQGLRFYRASSLIAIKKRYTYQFSSTLQSIENIGLQAMKTQQEAVIQEVFDVYSAILENLVTLNYPNLHNIVSMVMKHVNILAFYGFIITTRGTTRDNLMSQQDIAKPYKKLHELIFKEAHQASQVTNVEQRHRRQYVALGLIEELRSSLRGLAEKFKNPNHFMVLSFGQIIGDIGTLLLKLSVDNNWSTHHGRLINEVKSYIHLPTWFVYDVKKVVDNQSFESLIEAVTMIGLTAFEQDQIDIANEAIKILSKMAIDRLTKEKTKGAMYIEPSIMEKACYIGILALKKDKMGLFYLLKQNVETFDSQYKAVYFSDTPEGVDPYKVSPSPDKLKKNIIGLVSSRRGWQLERMGLNDSLDKLFELIVFQDVINFVRRIWGNNQI